MNTCQSFLEAMKFKGLSPFYFLLRLKYNKKDRKGRRERREGGGELRQQNVNKVVKREQGEDGEKGA